MNSSSKPALAGRGGAVSAIKSVLEDPEFRPVVRLLELLGRLQERDPESFKKAMGTLRAGLSGRSRLELRDGRRFAIIGPFAIPDDLVNDGERSKFRAGAATRSADRD